MNTWLADILQQLDDDKILYISSMQMDLSTRKKTNSTWILFLVKDERCQCLALRLFIEATHQLNLLIHNHLQLVCSANQVSLVDFPVHEDLVNDTSWFQQSNIW